MQNVFHTVYKHIFGLGKNAQSLNICLYLLSTPPGNVLLVNQYNGTESCREANSSSACRKIFQLLCSPICSLLCSQEIVMDVSVLNYINPVHITSYFWISNLLLPNYLWPPSRMIHFRSIFQLNCIFVVVSHSCYVFTIYLPRFDDNNNDDDNNWVI